jgi:hypothetical protein
MTQHYRPASCSIATRHFHQKLHEHSRDRSIVFHSVLGELIHDHVYLHQNLDALDHALHTQPIDNEVHPLASNCMKAIEHDDDLL